MFNKKGFFTLESIFYMMIMLILVIVLTTLISRNVYYQNNSQIKVYQGLSMLRNSIKVHQHVTSFSEKELMFNTDIKIRINNKQIYETPGYMPYLQNIEKAKFIKENNVIYLSFTYENINYKDLIFYVKQ